MKPIILSEHAKEQIVFRGATVEEVIETIRSSPWETAESGRLECKKEFPFENQWNKRYYKTKQVRAIFVDEPNEIVVITVYTYYY